MTPADHQNMLCARSTDLIHWTFLPDAMPRLPLWTKPGRTWAPVVKPRHTSWLAGTDGVCGPGGEDIVSTPGGTTWMVYHTWINGPQSARVLNVDRLTWDGDLPILDGPPHSPKPMPILP